LWIPKLKKHAQLLAKNTNYFRWLPPFFSSLNFLPVTFIFSFTRHLLINTWSSKLIQPITTSLCVHCTVTWKHLTSSLQINITNFIFQLLHIHNTPTFYVLTPLRSHYTPFAKYAHFSIDYENTYSDCIDFFTNYAHNFDDCVNTPDDWANIATDLTNTPSISSIDFCIQNPTLLQLLFFYRQKIKTMFTTRSIIYLHHSWYVVFIFDIFRLHFVSIFVMKLWRLWGSH